MTVKKSHDAIDERWGQFRETFAQKLRRFREKLGLSQEQLAQRVQISPRAVTALESAKYPSAKILNALYQSRSITDFEKHEAGIVEALEKVFGSVVKPNQVLDFRQAYRPALTTIACQYHQKKRATNLLSLVGDIPVFHFLPLSLKAPTPLSQFDNRLAWKDSGPVFLRPARNMASILKERTPSLYPGSIYRFLGLTKDGKLEFCPGDYYSFLNTCEILSYELADCLYNTKFAYDAITRGEKEKFQEIANLLAKEDAKLLPVRRSARPLDFGSRCTGFGTCALVVVKRANATPQMVLNVRSTSLSETPAMTHVIPAGTFQPNCNDDRFHRQEFSLQQNLVREFIEELLEDKHLRSDPGELMSFDSMFEGRGRMFWDVIIRENKFLLLYLGTVVDPVNLKPEVVCVFLVHEGFLSQIGRKLTKSWETEPGSFRMDDFSPTEIDRRISDQTMVPTGRSHLALVKRHYRTIQQFLNCV